MATDSPAPASLPALSDEWTKSRELIAALDERIHDTRKIVFGLFTSLLAASSVLGGQARTPALWLGVHLALLGLLVTGRFVEQQAFLLQAAAASRAWVLELFTPVELTGTLCDRFQYLPTPDAPHGKRSVWASRTTHIYMGLGVASAMVTGLDAFTTERPLATTIAYVLAVVVITAVYLYVAHRIGKQDVTFARDGMDWSVSATSARVGEPVHILLVNLEDKDLDVPQRPAEMVRLFDGEGRPAGSDPSNTVPLSVPPEVLVGGKLHERAACRWAWKPAQAGLWGLRMEVPRHPPVFARRFVHVEAPVPVDAGAPGRGEPAPRVIAASPAREV